MKIDDALRSAIADTVAARVDGGSAAGHLRIYSGAAPAGPGTAPTGTLLVDLPLNDPAFAAAVVGVIALDVTPTVSAVAAATGTAGYARLVDSTQAVGSGLGVADLTVSTVSAGTGEIQLATLSIVSGVTVEITSGSITMPAS
ncbi:hypothetical protein [Actinomadura macra]|uniref:hypothetical protein n=1 Tax=Actinomadura macra TaxID=46164 RepID=UPI0009FF8AE4|nr:hypothetical protein [Actinomadura macra]